MTKLILYFWLFLIPAVECHSQVVAPNRRLNGYPPTQGLVIWVDASILTSAQDTILSPWADLSGNANNINPQLGNMLVKTNSQNGFRTVRFNNGVAGRSVGPSFSAGGPWSVACAFKMDAAPGSAQRALQMFSSNFGLGSNGTANDMRLVWVNGGTVVMPIVASVIVPRVHIITTASTPFTQWKVGTSFNTTTNATTPAGVFSMGADTIAEPMFGNWFEFMCWNRVLSPLEQDQARNYMTSKWALPTTP